MLFPAESFISYVKLLGNPFNEAIPNSTFPIFVISTLYVTVELLFGSVTLFIIEFTL